MSKWSEAFSPKALGKFAGHETSLIILQSGRLQWSRPNLFNDPFDCQPRFRFPPPDEVESAALSEFDKVVRNLVPSFSITNELGKATSLLGSAVQSGKVSYEEASSLFKEDAREQVSQEDRFFQRYNDEVVSELQTSKILCLTKAFEEILMWSHYAKNHTGTLIIFSPKTNDSQFSIAKPVVYENYLPEVMSAQDMALLLTGQLSMTDSKSSQKAYDKITLTKAASWQYEKEWRIVGGDGFSKEKETELNRFSLDDVEAIIFGVKFPVSSLAAFSELASSIYPHAKLYRAGLSKKRFGLDLMDLE